MRWIIDHVLWDTGATERKGVWGWLWPRWKLFVAAVGAALMTWLEWVKHHPSEIAVVALIHFAFVLIAIALFVHVARWFRRGYGKSPPATQSRDPGSE